MTTINRWSQRLFQPVDIASLAMFRILFGGVMFAGTVRFMVSGWIDTLFIQPRHYLKYAGFEWVQPWPEEGMLLHYAAIAVAALFVSLGLFYRASALAFLVLFTYAQLIDISNYLNHYYLVVLLAGLLLVLPAHRAMSLDVWRKPELRTNQVPAWCVYLLRFQVAVVYAYAALAKFNPEWLLHAQPLTLWMRARVHVPVIGPWLDQLWLAYVMSWAGFLYDSLIVVFLMMKRTRVYAYSVVLLFHGMTYVFFDIGMFPFIMSTATLIFFSPAWPRVLVARLRGLAPPTLNIRPLSKASNPVRNQPWVVAALAAYVVVQVFVPLRHFAYPGDVLWNEQGMRYAWKVLVREKNGSLTYHVHERRTGRRYQVSAYDYLTWRQVSEMAGQPDLILQLAHVVARDLEVKGRGPVEVYADALVSLNGRRAQRLVDPTVDLSGVRDGLGNAAWILPGPTDTITRHRQWVRR